MTHAPQYPLQHYLHTSILNKSPTKFIKQESVRTLEPRSHAVLFNYLELDEPLIGQKAIWKYSFHTVRNMEVFKKLKIYPTCFCIFIVNSDWREIYSYFNNHSVYLQQNDTKTSGYGYIWIWFVSSYNDSYMTLSKSWSSVPEGIFFKFNFLLSLLTMQSYLALCQSRQAIITLCPLVWYRLSYGIFRIVGWSGMHASSSLSFN